MLKLEIKISLVTLLVEPIECDTENEICSIPNDVWIENAHFYLIFCLILLTKYHKICNVINHLIKIIHRRQNG